MATKGVEWKPGLVSAKKWKAFLFRQQDEYLRLTDHSNRNISLLAAFLSFTYHSLVAIFASYCPTDGLGVSRALWTYGWTTLVISYFGVIGVVAHRPILIMALACCIVLDSAILTLSRTVVLEYFIRRFHRERCNDPIELLGTYDMTTSFAELATAYRECERTLSFVHVISILILASITVAEGWFANRVYKYARMLQRIGDAKNSRAQQACTVETKDGSE